MATAQLGPGREDRARALRLLYRLAPIAVIPCVVLPHVAQAEDEPLARLAGHVPAAIDHSRRLPASAGDEAPVTLTIVLRRADQAGFSRYLEEVYDPRSPRFRRFLSPVEVSDRFGPTPAAYDRVRGHLERAGLAVVAGAENRLTLTVRGTRAQAERAFHVRIRDFEAEGRRFFANDTDPAVPPLLREYIQAVVGLSDLPRVSPATWSAGGIIIADLELAEKVADKIFLAFRSGGYAAIATRFPDLVRLAGSAQRLLIAVQSAQAFIISARGIGRSAVLEATGAGEKIGVLSFSDFLLSDVANFIALAELPEDLIDQVSKVHVNGGAARGPDESEVLLSIGALLAVAPGAEVVVYDAPLVGLGASFQALFNSMINDGATIISNSWLYCEDETTLADAQSLDAVLATAAASGITVLNATGDDGNSCKNGNPGTIALPAGSPNATAVGGTSLTVGPGFTYGSESWWDDSGQAPRGGQSGYGTSRFFDRPSYQSGLVAAAMRSVPDIVTIADPDFGLLLCQADAGGCPTGIIHGGTSIATPLMAAFTALLNEALGQPLGFLNPLLYPLAPSDAFHSAASMGTDVAHVGIGSPNLNLLHLALDGSTPGLADPNRSLVKAFAATPFAPFDGSVQAGGSDAAAIVVQLRDAGNNIVPGAEVTLTAESGSQALISPASGISTAANGAVVFTVTDPAIETVTFTAEVDGVELADTVEVSFVSPSAVAGGISANPTSVAADGTSTTTITVTLQDEHAMGTPGKLVTLSQDGSHSVVSGPSPAVTDANGQIQFTATNQVAEMVTYTAIDVTDGNLPIPGSTIVTFTGAGVAPCPAVLGTVMPEPGFSVTDFATGFKLAGCAGPIGVTFGPDGLLYVSEFSTGHIYRFGPEGGNAGPATRITSDPTPHAGACIAGLAFSKDGEHLYMARQFCNAFYGEVVEINPMTGAHLRTLAFIECATGLAIDPLSGDLFVSSPCGWFGGNNIYRIQNAATAPVVSVYASPGPTDGITFAPDGTLYSQSRNNADGQHYVTQFDGTDSATPGAFTRLLSLPGFPDGIAVAVDPADPSEEMFLFVNRNDGVMSRVDLTQDPPTASDVYTGSSRGDFVAVGGDGCAYATESDRILRITDADGTCPFAPTGAHPTLGLTPASVSPNPPQGSEQTFTATFFNMDVPPETPVIFLVAGPNLRTALGRTDANGRAIFAYAGIRQGRDFVFAKAIVGSETLISNAAEVTWEPGPHTTFLDLGRSPLSGFVGSPTTLSGALFDFSVDPPTPIPGAEIELAIDSRSCEGVSDQAGEALCVVTPDTLGMAVLRGSFAGTVDYLPAMGTTGFSVLEPVGERCSEGCTILAVKDSLIRRNARNRNEGANPRLTIRSSGSNRVLVSFDPSALRGLEFSRVHLVLTIGKNFGTWDTGRLVGVHPLLEGFTEGNGKSLDLPFAERSRGSGVGVTWECASDLDIARHRPDCQTKWRGGNFAPASATVLHTNATSGEVRFDVTADVRAGQSAWVVKKENDLQPGRVAYLSREGAALAGTPNLAPRLVLE